MLVASRSSVQLSAFYGRAVVDLTPIQIATWKALDNAYEAEVEKASKKDE
jgi:hypothetical protein